MSWWMASATSAKLQELSDRNVKLLIALPKVALRA